jgi:hypothetical protein
MARSVACHITHHKVAVVPPGHAVADPGAVMVEDRHTVVALTAVVAARWLDHTARGADRLTAWVVYHLVISGARDDPLRVPQHQQPAPE